MLKVIYITLFEVVYCVRERIPGELELPNQQNFIKLHVNIMLCTLRALMPDVKVLSASGNNVANIYCRIPAPQYYGNMSQQLFGDTTNNNFILLF